MHASRYTSIVKDLSASNFELGNASNSAIRVEKTCESVMFRIKERLTLCNSTPSGTQQVRQCCSKAFLTCSKFM